tara:strand:- start:89 stop:655 length:567 start_codon:yes stop_codon:yes gene_type:complete
MSSQINFGIKAGLNYDYIGDFEPTSLTIDQINSESKTGFHFGAFADIDLLLLYLRPEIIYSKNKTAFGDNSLTISKIELPILLGYKVIGPLLTVFTGPSFQYIINEKAKNLNIDKVKENYTLSLKIGARLKIKKIGLSLTYERGFTENEIKIRNNSESELNGHIHIRPNQFILSASYEFDFKKSQKNN